MPKPSSFHLYLYGPQRGPIRTSFEEAAARLTALPNLCFEADGSFVWARNQGSEQIYGMIYDANGMIQYCELQGKCFHSTWRQLTQSIMGQVDTGGLEVMTLPDQVLEDLQRFERECWSDPRP